MQKTRVLAFCAILLISAGIARAEQKFVIGNQYDFVFGGTNQGSFTSLALQNAIAPFFGFYPAIDLRSTGRTTQLNVAYTALAERFNGDQKLNSLAHSVTADFVARASRTVSWGLAGSFSSAPDYTSVDVLRGAAPSPDAFRFVFQPALAKSTMQTVRGSFNTKIDLNYRSYIDMEISDLSLNYQHQNNALNSSLIDQTRQEARLGYWYHLDPHQSLDVQYIFIRNDFNQFGTGRSQGVVVGYNRQFSPALRARFEAGPAYVVFGGTNSYGYFASASLMRKIRSSELTAFYSHAPADSSGLGSLSDLHSGGISVFSPLWKRFAIGSSVTGFLSRGIGNSTNDYRGAYGSVDLSYALSRRWFMTWGGSYRLNHYGNPLDQEFKRVYISLRFRAPELWRTSL